MVYEYYARAMGHVFMDRCPDCGGRLTRDHLDKTMEHMGIRISACEDRRISADGA
jgi:Zn-finger nucleic acid-binding protein